MIISQFFVKKTLNSNARKNLFKIKYAILSGHSIHNKAYRGRKSDSILQIHRMMFKM